MGEIFVKKKKWHGLLLMICIYLILLKSLNHTFKMHLFK